MAVSHTYKILWGTGLFFVILPHLNLGLLSDYKICGDSECESLMSRVQATKDHHGKDCRFLNFKRGDTIFVYHKLTGKREDLWAGSIDKQFGYFPKDAVQEEQVYAAMEKVVETRESDFFCMDEFGHIIDSSHLDSDDEYDVDEQIQNTESETIQTPPHTHDTNMESPSTSADVPTEPLASAQEADGTSTEEDENKNASDAAAGIHQEAQESPNKQGGSAPSPWLGSSVTGWLGLSTEGEEPENVAEGEKKDEKKETWWQGLGGEGKPDDAMEGREEEDRERADSFTSSMTGWLGFGGEKKTDQPVEKDEERENDKEQEPAETFRSRRMSLDLEGSQLHEEEKEETGTLGWLGNGLSNTLGFGWTSQESEREAEETIQGEKEQPASNSWFDMGVRDMLGYGKDKSEVGESTGSGFKETEEQPIGSSGTEEEKNEPASDESDESDKSDKSKSLARTEEETHQSELGQEGEGHPVEDSSAEFGSSHSTDTATEIMSENASEENKTMFSMSKSKTQMEEDADQDSSQQSDGDAHMLKGTEKDTVTGEVEESKEEEETIQGEKEQPTPNSWFDMGVRDMLGYGKDKSEVDESTGRGGFKETEQPTVSDTSQSQPAVTEEVTTETVSESQMEGIPKDQNVPSETETVPNSNNRDISDGSKDSVLPEDAEKDAAPQVDSEEKSQTAGLMSSVLNNFFQTDSEEEKEDDILDDKQKEANALNGEGSAEMEGKDNQTPESTENVDEDNIREPGEEEMKTKRDQGVLTQSDLSSGQPVGEVEEDKTEEMVEKKAEILNPDNTEESTDTSAKIGGDDHEGEGNNIETHHRDIFTTHTDGGTSGTEEEKNEPASDESDESDKSDSLALTEEETQSELGQEGEGHPVEGSSAEFGSSHSTDTATEILSENASEENRTMFSTSESKTQMEEDANRDSSQQSDGDAHMLKGTEKDTEIEESKEEERQGGTDELKEKQEKLSEVEEIKTLEKQHEVDEEKQEVEDLKEEGKHEECEELGGKIEELKKEEAEELMETRKQEEVEEIKEEDNQEQLKEDEKQGEEEELKEEEKKDEMEEIKEGKQDEVGELNGDEKQEVVEELKEEEKLQQIEESNDEKQKDEEELKQQEEKRVEEFKEVEEIKGKEKEDEENQVQSSDFEAEMENSLHSSPHQQKDIDRPESDSDEKETQGEIGLETSTQAEQIETETPQMEEEKKPEENKKQEEVEEEGKPKCSNELCPHSSEDGFVRDRDDSVDRLNSIDDSMTDSDQISADGTGVSQTIQFQSMEKDEDRKREEEKINDEGIEEQGEKKNSESDITMIEDVKSNSANSISDLNALGVHQISDNDLLYSGESGQNSHPDHNLVDQTAESKKDDELYSSEAKNTDFSDDDFLLEDSKTSSYGISAEQIHSEDKINTEEDTDMEKREINVKPDDVRVNENVGNAAEIRAEGETESSVSSSDPVMSEQAAPQESQHPAGSSLLSDGDNKGPGEAESRGGAFGLFKNAFSYFNQKPAAESTESAASLDSNTDETSEAQTTLTPDSTVDLTQVYVQDLHTDTPTTQSQEQLEPSSPPFIQTSSPPSTQTHSHPSSLSPNAKTLFKHYKNLLVHMSPDEMTILTELFGRHKLQFLDYILGSSETMNDNPDHDESILSDIERLLHHHRETLVAPSVRLVDAPQEDKDRTRTLIALQKLEMLLTRVKETFNTRKSDTTNTNHQGLDNITRRDEWLGVYEDNDEQLDADMGKEGVPEDEKRSEEEKVSLDLPQPLEGPGIMTQSLDFVHQIAEDSATHILAVRELLVWLTVQVVSSLPDDIRPGPDLYGVPWEPVIITGLLGLMTMLLFTCRCYSSVKSRMYRSRERWMAEQIAQLLDEKCKVLETLSKCQQEHDDLETSLRDSGVLAQTQKTENLEGKARQLGHVKRELERDLEQLKDQLEQQREHRIEQERRIAVLEENMKTFEEETKDLQSQDEQAQTTLKVYNMNSDRLQRNLETAGEENTLLQESNAQLRQQVEGWAERVSELEAEMSRYEVAYSGMLQDVTNKDERIMSLTDRLLRMRAWDSDLEEEEREEGGEKETSNGTAGRGEENGGGDKDDTQNHLQKVQKLIYAAKLNADLKSVDEDKDRAFAKLNDEIKAKEDLQESIKEMESEKLFLQSDTENYSEQVQRLQQKLQIMTEMYQENELKLHRMLTVEEKERLQKEEKLNKADKNIALAMEELNNYRQRAEEMEEELEKTKQSYQTQISAHEKKAHNNWLAARAADRDLADTRRENALLRQKLTDTQFKLDTTDKDPYALDSLARPLPFRAERSPYGPSPLGRPASETRAFLSPPTLMDGPPARLSPRVPRGPGEPPGGQGEMMERSGGPHSDSGSISPTWERDRRGPPPGPPGPLGPPGYMFPEPGGPMYRRPPPHPGAMGFLPPPGPHPPGPLHPRGVPLGPPHPADMADGPYRENSLGPGELEHRESGPGDRRTPPEADPRMGGPPPPGPMMGPMDGPFPRRAPYGPPPPEFYHPRGPGGPPMMPMWAPPPPGVMFPPRFPPGGPPLPPPSHPHHGPHMRPPLPDGLPPPSMGPVPPHQSPPHSQSPEQQTTSPEDAI